MILTFSYCLVYLIRNKPQFNNGTIIICESFSLYTGAGEFFCAVFESPRIRHLATDNDNDNFVSHIWRTRIAFNFYPYYRVNVLFLYFPFDYFLQNIKYFCL